MTTAFFLIPPMMLLAISECQNHSDMIKTLNIVFSVTDSIYLAQY